MHEPTRPLRRARLGIMAPTVLAFLACLSAHPASAAIHLGKKKHHHQREHATMMQASYYSDTYQGSATASGGRYDRQALTAAHPTLPLHTRVRVTNPANKRSVVVLINDRCAGARGSQRLDLSLKAAQTIGIVSAGRGRVRVERVHRI